MTTRRQFLARGASVAVVAGLGGGAAAVSAGGAAADTSHEERTRRALKLQQDLKRYATMAAVAQSVPAPEV